jgi:integrase
MPVYKRKSRSKDKTKSKEVLWCYRFSGPGATRQDRRDISESGFKTRKEAQEAEAARRVEEQKKHELASAGAAVAGELPKTLGQLLEEFFAQRRLGLKTVESYRDDATRLSPELLAMPLEPPIRPLHMTREWNRLLDSGGRKRGTGEARPLSAKTVRNVAGMLSSAFNWGIKEGLVAANPVTQSDRPKKVKRKGMALTPVQQDLLVEAASGPWCMSMILDMDAAVGARRGEMLALRWSDYQDGRVTIERSLCQTYRLVDTPKGKRKVHDVLTFKTTKKDNIRVVGLPESIKAKLEAHRQRQAIFRQQYGRDYQADLDLIFANPDGSPLKPNSISSTVSALFKRLGIPKPKGAALHLLRHSHGSHLLAQNVELTVVAERLGHSVKTLTDIYSHAIHGRDDEAVRKWEEFQERERNRDGKRVQ